MNRTRLDKKLNESKYHYEHMIQHVKETDLTKLKYATSAFINAGRSVTQYAHEAAKDQGRVEVYKALVTNKPLLKFFKELRDVNIHYTPVQISADAQTDFSSSLIVRTKDTTDEEMEAFTAAQINQRLSKIPTAAQFYFYENHNEEVLPLCEKYLVELEEFAAKAKEEGIAPPDEVLS